MYFDQLNEINFLRTWLQHNSSSGCSSNGHRIVQKWFCLNSGNRLIVSSNGTLGSAIKSAPSPSVILNTQKKTESSLPSPSITEFTDS